jgi:hypothetical protein
MLVRYVFGVLLILLPARLGPSGLLLLGPNIARTKTSRRWLGNWQCDVRKDFLLGLTLTPPLSHAYIDIASCSLSCNIHRPWPLRQICREAAGGQDRTRGIHLSQTTTRKSTVMYCPRITLRLKSSWFAQLTDCNSAYYWAHAFRNGGMRIWIGWDIYRAHRSKTVRTCPGAEIGGGHLWSR